LGVAVARNPIYARPAPTGQMNVVREYPGITDLKAAHAADMPVTTALGVPFGATLALDNRAREDGYRRCGIGHKIREAA
jgi:hypothetical protein